MSDMILYHIYIYLKESYSVFLIFFYLNTFYALSYCFIFIPGNALFLFQLSVCANIGEECVKVLLLLCMEGSSAMRGLVLLVVKKVLSDSVRSL